MPNIAFLHWTLCFTYMYVSHAPQLMSCNYFVCLWPPFIFWLPYDHLRSSHSWQFPYRTLVAWQLLIKPNTIKSRRKSTPLQTQSSNTAVFGPVCHMYYNVTCAHMLHLCLYTMYNTCLMKLSYNYMYIHATCAQGCCNTWCMLLSLLIIICIPTLRYITLCNNCLICSAPSSLTSEEIFPPPPGFSQQHPPASSSHATSSPCGPGPLVTTTPQNTATTTSSDSGGDGGSRRRPHASGSTATTGASGQTSGSVTGDALQQALANAFSSIQTPSRAAQVSI